MYVYINMLCDIAFNITCYFISIFICILIKSVHLHHWWSCSHIQCHAILYITIVILPLYPRNIPIIAPPVWPREITYHSRKQRLGYRIASRSPDFGFPTCIIKSWCKLRKTKCPYWKKIVINLCMINYIWLRNLWETANVWEVIIIMK